MHFNKKSKIEYTSMLAAGFFFFEGKSTYASKMIVITVGDGHQIFSSSIPPQWLPAMPTADEAVGEKRKKFKGPGIENFKTARSAVINSKKLTEKIADRSAIDVVYRTQQRLTDNILI